jgi:hypothetical protein
MWKTDEHFIKDVSTFVAYTDLFNYRGIKAYIKEKYDKDLVHVKRVLNHNADYTKVNMLIRFTFDDDTSWLMVHIFDNEKEDTFYYDEL